MARPPRVERLRHGRLLSGSVFRFFVETWNWIVGYVDNMRGDADVNPQNGHITIDRSDPDNPVIRFRADKLQPGGAGGSVSVAADGPFSPVYEDDPETGDPTDVVTGFQNCFWQDCGRTYLMGDQTIPGTDGFIALRAGATPSTAGQATLYCYPTFAALQAAQGDLEYFVIPIYRVSGGRITLDMRRLPHIYLVEVLP